MAAVRVGLIALPGIPLIRPGDDLAAILIQAIEAMGQRPCDRDVLVVAQKIVSKAEGRYRRLDEVTASTRAQEIAHQSHKDPRLIEVILSESAEIIRCKRDVVIVEHRLGLIMANAGIDQSNVANPASGEFALLLPEDPDTSAARLRARLAELCGCEPGVVISDSFGRPWRIGTVGVAIGCAGIPATLDLRGQTDLFGRALRVTVVGHVDEIAAAASLLMGQADEGRPVILVRGLAALHEADTRSATAAAQSASALIRPAQQDLFR